MSLLFAPISLNFPRIWLLISFPQGQGYHHTEVVYLLCTQTASTTSFRFTLRCLSVHASSKPELDPAKLLLSTPHTLVWLPTFSDRPLWLVFRSISFTVCGQTALMSTVSCPSDIKVCHCGHLMPESGPAHNSSCRSSHLPPRLNLENLLSPSLLLLPFPSSHPHFFPPKPAWPSWTILPPLQNYFLPTDSFAPAAAAICLLNLSLSVGAMPTAWPPHALAGIKPVLDNFLTVLSGFSGRSYFPSRISPRTSFFSTFLSLPAAWFSFSSLLQAFRHSSPQPLLLSCCIPDTSPPDISSGSDHPARSAELSPRLINFFGKRQLKR